MTSTKIALKNIKDVTMSGILDGQILQYDSTTETLIPATPQPANITILDVSGNKTLGLDDANTLQRVTTTAGITIPLNSSVPFDTGATMIIYAKTASGVTLLPASGVLINTEVGLILNDENSVAVLVKEAADEWLLYGSLRAT